MGGTNWKPRGVCRGSVVLVCRGYLLSFLCLSIFHTCSGHQHGQAVERTKLDFQNKGLVNTAKKPVLSWFLFKS